MPATPITSVDPKARSTAGPGPTLEDWLAVKDQPTAFYPRIAQAFYGSPWAITREKLAEIEAFIRAKVTGRPTAWKDYDDNPPASFAGPRSSYQIIGRTALIPVFGVLCQRANMLQDISGGVSTEKLGSSLDEALADPAIRSICLVFDSPGGSVFGIQELGQKIYQARGQKKVVAIADSMAASAAYWLASQASELTITPGGQVGSIGVIAAHVDESKAEELAGYKTTLVTAGKYKGEGDPSQPLSEDAQAYLQDMINKYYAMFLAAVARGRGVTEARVEKDFGQGRMLLGKDAQAAGMVDRVATLPQVLKQLGAGEAANGATVAAVVAARARAARICTANSQPITTKPTS